MLGQFRDTQPHATKMLLNSYRKNRLSHAYLFEGEPGTPKKALAIEFAKLLYCENDQKPCGNCMNCLRIDHQNHPNVILIEPEGRTLKRNRSFTCRRNTLKQPLKGPKIYIIDAIDKMSISAANSILKFIEEPEPNVYTIMTTDQLHQILPTLFRGAMINFKPVDRQLLKEHLIREGLNEITACVVSQLTNVVVEAESIAKKEEFEALLQFVIELGEALIMGTPNPIALCEGKMSFLYSDRESLDYGLNILLLYMRDLQKGKFSNDDLIFKQSLEKIKPILTQIDIEWINRSIEQVLLAQIDLRSNVNQLLILDSLLIKLMKVVYYVL